MGIASGYILMKKLIFEGEFKASLLAEELFDAFPEWVYKREMNSEMRNWTDVIIRHGPGEFIISGPSNLLDEKAIGGVVKKHDPSKLSKGEKQEKEKKAKKDSIKLKLKDIGFTDDEIDLLLE